MIIQWLIVSAAIFGDGAACTLLSSHPDDGPEILAEEMYHFIIMSI
jgi:3-oxoacyl-[acyl-carrier-protein] synthase III